MLHVGLGGLSRFLMAGQASCKARGIFAAAAAAAATASIAAERRQASCMPSSSKFTVGELNESKLLLEVCEFLDDGDDSDVELADDLMMLAAEPLARSSKQEIGPERLSLERLRREAAERGMDGDTFSSGVYARFGFRLDWLEHVVHELRVPDIFETKGRHYFSGEEGVLLLLRRFRSTGTLQELTWETGRSTSAISECVEYMVEHVLDQFPHLADHRSFTAWAPHFGVFAQAFHDWGCPIPNLIGFVDGKLYPVCRPGRYQNVLYSGHKRIHGLKVQGLVFPNGIQPYPFGPVNGSRHDSFVLTRSGIIQVLRDVCRGGRFAWGGAPGGLGEDYVLFGDSAYPLSRWLWRMYKGVMTALQQRFNADMSPARVSVEWGFGKITDLWPFLDYRKKHKVLLSPVGLYFPVANILTNMHTCLSKGNIISAQFQLEPPELHAYMRGGPFI